MKLKSIVVICLMMVFAWSCKPVKEAVTEKVAEKFDFNVEQFADIKVLRYQIPGWENLSLKEQKLVYYLTQAGLAGRDIMWDQNYRHNLKIRKALENIYTNYSGDKTSEDWKAFEVYLKRVWFSNGIHHHYSNDKLKPEFSRDYLNTLLSATNTELKGEAFDVIFNDKDTKKVNQAKGVDNVALSAVNFYGPDVTNDDVIGFYKNKKSPNPEQPLSYGLNSQLVKENGELKERVYKSGGLYGSAIDEIVKWLEKAQGVAENKAQGDAIGLLIKYYKTGDLQTWDDYNVAWTAATEGNVDYINSFIEVYNDPLGYRGSYETIVQINDFDMSKKMKVLSDNAQWFEDNSPLMDEHKKKNVVGVTYKVVTVAGEAGDASPSTPIGVNLPNANWIRATHGSKSVSLGNIIEAYDKASGGAYTNEFGYSDEEKQRAEKYGSLGGKLHTALHEVVGHASGQLNPGVGTPKETLKNYASTLEEARADLVALYYLMDQKLIDIKLMETLEVGKAEYDGYIRNGMMVQLRRLKPGEILEEAHMRNRQLVASWAYEKGLLENVIEKKVVDNKTYFVINDYEKLRVIFGELLREIQRIKSEGDYEAGKNLVENYGVQVDSALHQEVLARSEKLNVPGFSGFVNPILVPVMENDTISGFTIEYAKSFEEQMLDYSNRYGNL
jgi:dipeptidyl-peptidase-3